MSLKGIKLKTIDMNKILKDPEALKGLRALTLRPTWEGPSGMNTELNSLREISKTRKVEAKAITAWLNGDMIGWSLCSKESSDFPFMNGSFEGKGVLFQVFVDHRFRRKGVGTALLRRARRVCKEKLTVCPWDDRSYSFFEKHKKYEMDHV
jgi:GNAT superfamily N-acetyltransferase